MFILDENWDDDQLLGFEPCNENLITGCNIINGKCECDTIRTCNNPFEFPSRDTCLSALKRIEGKRLSSVIQSQKFFCAFNEKLGSSLICFRVTWVVSDTCGLVLFRRQSYVLKEDRTSVSLACRMRRLKSRRSYYFLLCVMTFADFKT